MNAKSYRADWELEGCPGDYTTWLEQKLAGHEEHVSVLEHALWQRAGAAAEGNPRQQQVIYNFWYANGVLHKYLDRCQSCRGMRGGVRGNENVVDGVILCDYCSVERQKGRPALAA